MAPMSAVVLSCIFFVFSILHLGVCDWTFSLRITSALCCNSTVPCDELGSCENLTIGVCIRQQDVPLNDRGTCSLFLVDPGRDIIERELIPPNFNDLTTQASILTTEYQGGLQIYVGVGTTTLIAPPFRNLIDVILETVGVMAGSGGVSIIGDGANQRVNFTFLISVDCSPGFGGDGCNKIPASSVVPTTSTSIVQGPSPTTQSTQSTGTSQTPAQTPAVSPVSPTQTSSDDEDPVPIIVGVVVGVIVVSLLIIAIIIIAVCIFLQYRNNEKTNEYRVTVSHFENSTTEAADDSLNPEAHIYSTINKDKKKRRIPPAIPAPYQVPLTEMESETTPSDDQVVSEDDQSEEESANGEPVRNSEGLLYAQLDHENRAARPKPTKPKTTPKPLEKPVTYSTVNTSPYSVPRTPPQPANPGEEVTYYSTVSSTD